MEELPTIHYFIPTIQIHLNVSSIFMIFDVGIIYYPTKKVIVGIHFLD